ncbi:kelch domain protein [Alcanivorax hongdengensis A-11-3]|uniref:Kelch domain protein n=1 Tax=Alcanivorax hongdengensis A-11-3 TaxID=1177179 RepID=L0WDX7_9GAMM|nr:galactose oxidase early set domain-containing protein [Alcanivorax hongdengensis]EKF75251.1 kelch domain protein [Alcanivorax hongdengensis A-11-3]
MKAFNKLASLAAASVLLVACGGGGGGNATPVSSTNNAQEPRAADPMAPAPPPDAASFAGRDYRCVGEECRIGKFSGPFAEPTIRYSDSTTGDQLKVVTTDDKCIKDAENDFRCKPTAGSVALLPDDRLVYFNALEGTENVELSIVAEFGFVSVDDQTRVLSLGPAGPVDQPSWQRPSPLSGGANVDGNDSETLLPGKQLTDAESTAGNDGALFCADLVALADGRIMAVGGTDYYTEPSLGAVFPQARDVLSDFDAEFPLPSNFGRLGVPDDIGVAELEGLKDARIFNPDDNSWTQTGHMSQGRWYPTLVTLADGDVFVASGVTKLLKPVYTGNLLTGEDPVNGLADLLQSADNVRISETYHLDTGNWTENGEQVGTLHTADKSLPLFPRLHLLPNGQVLYNAGGQAFNPFGQSYNQAQWNVVSAYNPKTQRWNDLGYAGLNVQLNQLSLERLTSALTLTNPDLLSDLNQSTAGLLENLLNKPLDSLTQVENLLGDVTDPQVVNRVLGAGFRGSTFSVMMPLKPDDNGQYHKAEFLTAGGVLGLVAATSPGSYLAVPNGRIDTVEVGVDGDDTVSGMRYSSRIVGNFSGPRWYPYGVLLPDGSVMAFNGGNRDGVVLPGLDVPVRLSERFDPVSESWQPMATSLHPRTYHNTALLLPDGRVLIGGHAPINTAYLFSLNLESLGLSPNDGRDPSFEVYSPPYVFKSRPVIEQAPTQVNHGDRITVKVDDAGAIHQVLLVRRTATTHLVDGDQRTVVLPFTVAGAHSLSVQVPGNPAVAPAGHYMLFVNRMAEDGSGMIVPSVSAPVHVSLPTPLALASYQEAP